MFPSATIDPTMTDSDGGATTEEAAVVARIAAQRAAALREFAVSIGTDSLSPLTRALHRRAGELELTAAVLAEEPSLGSTPIRSIA